MQIRVVQHSFNGGEISSRMGGRADLDGIWDRSLEVMENAVATVEGPALKRGGFALIQPAAPSASWLSRFVFNTTQSYVLEWGDGFVRFYTNGGQILGEDGLPYELAVPFTAAEAREVCTRQSFDRLYCAHPKYPPGAIKRLTATTFVYEPLPLKAGPFKDWNTDKAKLISWDGSPEIDGFAYINAGFNLFEPGQVGAPFIFEVRDLSIAPAWESQVKTEAIAIGALRRSDGKVYSLVDKTGAVRTGTIQPTHTEGDEWDGSRDTMAGTTDDKAGVKWRYRHDRFGVGTIVEIESPTRAKIKVTRRLPTGVEVGKGSTYKWAHGAFSDKEGWPRAVSVWAQRLCFFKDADFIASVTGDYFNMSPIDKHGAYAEDQAFRKTLAISDPILWAHPDKDSMLCGTASEEILIGLPNRAAGLSSTNLNATPQSRYGSGGVFPVAIGTAILFPQRGGRKIREAAYTYERERFVGANISIYARHITRSGLRWLAFQQEPEEMLWGGRADGTLIAHPHSPEQDVKGFSRCKLAAGTVIAGTVIPSEDGERDELWILAELDGFKGVLRLADWWDEDPELGAAEQLEKLKGAFFVDWGVSYDGPAKASFTTGLAHLEGREVVVLADGATVRGLTVTGGAITLPNAASKVHIGLGYTMRLKFLRGEQRGRPSIQGLRRKLERLVARLIDSAVAVVRNKRGDRDRLFDRPNNLPMTVPAPLKSADVEKAVGGGRDFDETLEILHDEPLPFMLALAAATYDVEEPKQ